MITSKNERAVRIRVTHNGKQYLGECLEYPVMTHGATLEELAGNMRQALDLFMQEEGGASDEGAILIRLNLGAAAGWSGDLA